ncbi:diacylglycerol kinase family protein [Novosphingobium sp. B-7]|uniref:diacylglycerol kinase family protein n=1 Tax=Novosphingobium sp. B-7 TaxID=1298855 RepID=UPI000683F06F|nr:diacylglycerol kinase family protein [Novosphingobium sp. B-7]
MQSSLRNATRLSFISYGVSRLRSIGFALHGIGALIRNEPNAHVHLVASLAVVLAGLVLHCGLDDWRWLALAMAMVWIAEAFNTAIEVLCNLVQPDFHPQVKQIKDLAAGAVLLAAMVAALIGASVAFPHLFGGGA